MYFPLIEVSGEIRPLHLADFFELRPNVAFWKNISMVATRLRLGRSLKKWCAATMTIETSTLLAALLVEGFIGFTGGVPKPEDSGYPHQDAYYLSRIFHCYSMGPGSQRYDGVAISVRNKDSNFFIAGKGLLYFHERAEKRREWWAVAGLGLVSAIIAGCATGLLAATYWPA